MCNTVFMEGSDLDPRPIPETGTGWKIFYVRYGVCRPAYHRGTRYKLDGEGWAHFDKTIGSGDAFCFFLDLETAIINLRAMDNFERLTGKLVIHPIKYKGGIQARLEPGVLGRDGLIGTIGLANSFRILKEVSNDS